MSGKLSNRQYEAGGVVENTGVVIFVVQTVVNCGSGCNVDEGKNVKVEVLVVAVVDAEKIIWHNTIFTSLNNVLTYSVYECPFLRLDLCDEHFRTP